jgi:hypothetical protein
MKRGNRMVRASGAVCLIGAAMVGARAHAALITDSFQFDNPASDGSSVGGTFTFDTSNPTVLTDLTITARGQSNDTAVNWGLYSMPTFDGTELEGELNVNFEPAAPGDNFQVFFGPGAVGNGTNLYQLTPTASVTFSGPITYTLNSPPPSSGGSSAPLPAGALSGFAAMLAMGGFAARVRKPA